MAIDIEGIKIEPMTPEQFKLAIAEIPRTKKELIDAAEAVLVAKARPGEAVERFGVSLPALSRSVARIEEQLLTICERENWRYETIILDPDDMEFAQRLQNKTIAPLMQKLAAKKLKKTEKTVKKNDRKKV